jgi:hypothetical protein
MGDDDAPGSQPARRRSGSLSDQEFAAAGADSDVEEDSDHHSIDARELAGMNNSSDTYRSPTKGLLSTSVIPNSVKKVKSSHQKMSGAPKQKSRLNLHKSSIQKAIGTAKRKPGLKPRAYVGKGNASQISPSRDSSPPSSLVEVAQYAYPAKVIPNHLPASAPGKGQKSSLKRRRAGGSRSASLSGNFFKAYARSKQIKLKRPLRAATLIARSARDSSECQDNDSN